MDNATNRWLDKLAKADKARGGTGSDYRLAQILGIERQAISRYRRGADKSMGDEIAGRLADKLGVHPMVVIGDVRAERSKDARLRGLWANVARAAKKGGIAAAVILSAPGALALSEAAGRVCILCKVSRGNSDRANSGRAALA